MELSYISGNGNPKLSELEKLKKPSLKKFLIFREMELSSSKFKKLLIFQERTSKPEKQTKTPTQK